MENWRHERSNQMKRLLVSNTNLTSIKILLHNSAINQYANNETATSCAITKQLINERHFENPLYFPSKNERKTTGDDLLTFLVAHRPRTDGLENGKRQKSRRPSNQTVLVENREKLLVWSICIFEIGAVNYRRDLGNFWIFFFQRNSSVSNQIELCIRNTYMYIYVTA